MMLICESYANLPARNATHSVAGGQIANNFSVLAISIIGIKLAY
ncbi:MAG: hypothetical protein UW28_C0028G0021 [Parcubacteria group bacterium GW2011_GWA2_44_13]|nr:MAG: hypothetical protein UW28_C0028G0021 [Parcubacteria group bacterium GW2011_GWA2_44_13]